jgi:hypothetical protein
MRDLGRHRVKHHCSLLSLAPITFDTNTLSCYGGSYFATIAVIFCHFPKTYELGRAINAHIIVAAYYSDHYLLFRVYSVAELSPAFIITAPEGATVVYTNTSVIFFFRVTSHEHGACPPRLYTIVYFSCTSLRRSRYRFLFSPTDPSKRSHYFFPLQQLSQ